MPFNTPTATIQLTATPSPSPVPTTTQVCLPPAVLFQGLTNCNSHFQYLGFYNWKDVGQLLTDYMDKYRYFSLNTPVYGHVIAKALGDGTYLIVESTGGFETDYPVGKVGQMNDKGVVGVLASRNDSCWLSTYLSGATIENNSTFYYETTARRYKMWNYDPTTPNIVVQRLGVEVSGIPIEGSVGQCEINPQIATITNPYGINAKFALTGFVEDDVLIDGVVFEDGAYPYYDIYGGGCNGVNEPHSFTYTNILSANQTVRIGCADNGHGNGKLQAIATIEQLSLYNVG